MLNTAPRESQNTPRTRSSPKTTPSRSTARPRANRPPSSSGSRTVTWSSWTPTTSCSPRGPSSSCERSTAKRTRTMGCTGAWPATKPERFTVGTRPCRWRFSAMTFGLSRRIRGLRPGRRPCWSAERRRAIRNRRSSGGRMMFSWSWMTTGVGRIWPGCGWWIRGIC
uniref:(northern house mosquito) hypothetical protein n=1 Tax=Culex pipiens TaxID=7175 RepID=A0A8D8CXR6_CULPI